MKVRFHHARSIVTGLLLLTIIIRPATADEADELLTLRDQVPTLLAAGQYQQAAALAERLVSRAEIVFKDRPVSLARCLTSLANVYKYQARLAEAEPLCKRALSLSERALNPEHPDVVLCVNNLAALYGQQGRLAEAEPLFKRALAIWEKTLDPAHPDIADGLLNLAHVYNDQGRYAEAEPLYRRALAIREKALGDEHPDVAHTLNLLASLCGDQARFREAELLHKQAFAIWEKALGKEHPDVAIGLANLAVLYVEQGRYAEAEPLYKRSLAIKEKAFGKEHPRVASSLANLANLYIDQGRYVEAETLHKRALAIFERALGAEHTEVAKSLNSLAGLYSAQGRFADAEPLCKRSLAIREKALGAEHPDLALALNNLAAAYYEQERYAEAEPLYQRALNIWEKALGVDHPNVALGLNNLAKLCSGQGRFAEAEPQYKRGLAIREKALGREHPEVADSLCNLAVLYNKNGRYAEAEPLIDRAIDIENLAGAAAGDRSRSYLERARVKWKRDRRAAAIADLDQALQLAEQQRSQSSGGEQDRAQAFAQFGRAYEQMVEWQTVLGDVGAALAAIERSRARSLMDQMSAAYVDLLAGVSAEQAQPLRAQEAAAQMQVASVEKKLEMLRLQTELSTDERERQVAALQKDLVTARQTYVDAFAAIRNASPAYRQMVSQDFESATLDEIQARLAGDDRVVLEYVLGFEGGYLLVIPPQGQKARIERLALREEQAAKLGVQAGPLTDERMRAILSNEAGAGLLQQLRSAEKAEATTDRLAILWQVLIPESERKLLVEGKLKRCIVIPDAALAAFPFETLVVEPGDNPKYLLDVGPPIVTAPSATLLMNLTESKPADGSLTSNKLLSVADPNYGAPSAGPVSALAEVSARSRYGALRGDLSPLPFTAWECSWVAETFRKAGLDAGVLQKANAREVSVRKFASGRKYLHFACHGLVDQSHGNLFGALALTPGPSGAADPADDGFLTLAEIYELNLRGTELSILSACDTNFGPNQKGEGSWSLSRGFLVAGSKRVVASNWLVDDEAGASLVSVFCGDITKAKSTEQLDYAASLQAAKRWVRNQEKWQSPYYWGTFVLVGPN